MPRAAAMRRRQREARRSGALLAEHGHAEWRRDRRNVGHRQIAKIQLPKAIVGGEVDEVGIRIEGDGGDLGESRREAFARKGDVEDDLAASVVKLQTRIGRAGEAAFAHRPNRGEVLIGRNRRERDLRA